MAQWIGQLTTFTDQCWAQKRVSFAAVCWSSCKQAVENVTQTNPKNEHALNSAKRVTKRCVDFYNRFAHRFNEDKSAERN